VDRPVIVYVPLSPVGLLTRVFVSIFDTIDLVTKAVGLIEKARRISAYNLEMLSVARQELLPMRNTRHYSLTRGSPSAALNAVLPRNVQI
jgi:hypothetical protein